MGVHRARQAAHLTGLDCPRAPGRDVEAEEQQETPWAQQEQFEAEQIKKAATKFGAKDRKSKAGGCGGGQGEGRLSLAAVLDSCSLLQVSCWRLGLAAN